VKNAFIQYTLSMLLPCRPLPKTLMLAQSAPCLLAVPLFVPVCTSVRLLKLFLIRFFIQVLVEHAAVSVVRTSRVGRCSAFSGADDTCVCTIPTGTSKVHTPSRHKQSA
jgi:hypothetical protein